MPKLESMMQGGTERYPFGYFRWYGPNLLVEQATRRCNLAADSICRFGFAASALTAKSGGTE